MTIPANRLKTGKWHVGWSIFKKGIGGIDALVKSFSVSKIYAMVRESPETFRYFCFFTFSET